MTRTPPPYLVIDIRTPAWAALCAQQPAMDAFLGWLLEQGFDPEDLVRIEVYDVDSPMPYSPVWARVTDTTGTTTTEALGCVPPLCVRMAIAIPQQQKQEVPGNSDIFFRTGQPDDPTPPFPSLSPREIAAVEEAEMQAAQRAELAYRVFSMSHGLVDASGEPVIPWGALGRCCARAWETTAAAVTADVHGEQELKRALAVRARESDALAVIGRALDSLPTTCPYHGEHTDPESFPLSWGEACCGAGVAAQRRKQAEAALASLREDLAE